MLIVKQRVEQVLFGRAMTYASHLINRLSSSAIGGKTPIEMWSGMAASDYDMLRVFGLLSCE